MTPLIPRPGAQSSVSDLMQITGALFKATVMQSAPVAMLATLLNQVPNFYLLRTGWTMEKGIPGERTFWLLLLLTWLPGVFLYGLITLRQQAVMTGGSPTWLALAGRMAPKWPRLALTLLLAALATFAGFLLFIVPGVFLVFCFVLLQPLVLASSLSPVDALVNCYRLARPVWVKVVSSTLIGLMICIVFGMLGVVVLNVAASVAHLLAPGLESALGETLQALMLAIAGVYFSALSVVLHASASSSA